MSGETFATIRETQKKYRAANSSAYPVGATPVRKTLKEFVYDFNVHGGSIGRHIIGELSPYLRIEKVTYDVVTEVTTANTNAGHISFGIVNDADIIADSAVSAGNFVVANDVAGVPDGTEAKSVKVLDKTSLQIKILGEPVLSGKVKILLEVL